MKRVIVIVVVAALAVGGFFTYRYYQAQQSKSALSSLQTAKAARGSLTATVGTTGTVRPDQTGLIAWQTSGRVGEVKVKVGDLVKTGDILATLDPTSLSANIILAQTDLTSAQNALETLRESKTAQAQAQVTLVKAQTTYTKTLNANLGLVNYTNSQQILDAQQSFDQAQGLVDQLHSTYSNTPGTPETNPAKAKLKFDLRIAQAKRDRAQYILDLYGGDPSQSELDKSNADLALAKAQLEDAQRAWDKVKDGPSEDDLASAQARVDAAQATLALGYVSAPFDGTITDVSVKRGDLVKPGMNAFQIDNLSALYVDTQVSEVDINRIQPSQPVSLTFDAILGSAYNGTVIEVAKVGSPVQGVVEFNVTIRLTDADENVRPGMTAAVNVIVEQLSDVLLVPNRAVRVQDGQRVVYIMRSGALQPVSLELGSSSDTSSQVIGGELREGDEIVLNPPLVFDTSGPPSFMRR